jgi:serine/threonine-protein kinase
VLVDRYRVGEMLGQGTSGSVFEAEHLAFARPAAIKIVRTRLATPELVKRVFHGDALTAWGRAHPSLTEVFDIGALADGTPYFVMEWLEGETLATRIARERLSLAAGIDMMMQLLSAVVAMHARDLLVRDLRPNNIFLVNRRGCRPLVKVLDVGLGRLVPLERLQDQWQTSGPQPGAHPHYLSPERARGEHLVEAASDIFVAGAVLYEALAGERAFGGTSWRSIVEQVTRGEPVPLHERRPDIPFELSQFVSRSLSPNPRTRPSTAKEMQDELRAIFEDARKASVSIYAPPPSVRKPAREREREPTSASRIPLEGYVDETETRRTPRSVRPPPAPKLPSVTPPSGEHPAAFEEMEQTLERLEIPAAVRQSAIDAVGEEDETKSQRVSAEIRARLDQLVTGESKKPPR